MTRKLPFTQEQVVQLYHVQGLTMQQVRVKLGVGYLRLQHAMNAWGIERNGGRVHSTPSREELERRYVVEGQNLTTMRRELRMGDARLKRLLAEAGIPLRKSRRRNAGRRMNAQVELGHAGLAAAIFRRAIADVQGRDRWERELAWEFLNCAGARDLAAMMSLDVAQFETLVAEVGRECGL